MRLTLGELAPSRYYQRRLELDGPVTHQLLLQARRSGEVELVVVLTCLPGDEHLLEEVMETGQEINPLSVGPSGDALERISKGWSVWPGDMRAPVPTRMVTFYATLPAGVRDVKLELPTMRRSHVIDLENLARLSVEDVRGDLSMSYAVINDAIFCRVAFYVDGGTWPPPLRINTLGEIGGAQIEGLDESVEARLASWESVEKLLSYPIEVSPTDDDSVGPNVEGRWQTTLPEGD
ncbi:hypothetical protein EDF62_1035 [Leucobacter luti]|uniref:Uncharacterized protein n=1 Tax=Leucobacter luti TaxID=340320 RepID=A0A4R6S742_9MICO|nr:hypothetical protein [Leucobacter luti]TDP94615.1 hypothetical protein EDF62_1035 [Leucobacter luti]